MKPYIYAGIAAAACLASAIALADPPPAAATPNYERRVFDIAMRDGATLHTVVVIPKGAKDAPILLTRTPYNAEQMTQQRVSNDLRVLLDGFDNAVDVIADGGYIRVVQDIRGRFASGGDFIMNRPLAGGTVNPSSVDESTDAYDTIDWLVKNVGESNGKVGVLGISYNGFEALMALVDPHPALKAAVPMDPMVDGWRGDDWFHNGAYRQYTIGAIYGSGSKDHSAEFVWGSTDIYDTFMRAGSAGELGRQHGLDQVPFWRAITEHAAYDDFWQSQAVDRVLAQRPLKTPVMLVASLWDQEDRYGASAVYRAIKPNDRNNLVHLTLGPWSHGQSIKDGSSIGNVRFDQDTAKWWRKQVLTPFLARHLKGESADVAPVTAFQSGTNEWQRLQQWPPPAASSKLYLKPNSALGFEPAAAGPIQTADYVSDPAHPVTFVQRPARLDDDGEQWESWLTSDQRHAASRPDVLTFVSDVLTKPVTIAGQPLVKLTASTSGTDSDWVVKLIDVYPDEVAGERSLGGYQLPISMEIFRGRYRKSLAAAMPLEASKPLRYEFALPDANHVFLPGHRIMVQVQSSWFPLYDRNPQTFVANIFFAKPGDYVKATQRVVVAGQQASYIELPIVQ